MALFIFLSSIVIMIAIIVISKLIKEKNKRSDTKPHDDDDDGDDHQMDVYIESYKKPYTRDYRPRLKPDDFLKDKVDTFLAIDFETATGSRNSACQLGLVLVENRVIVKEQTMLIQPPENKYNVRNTAVHGISASKTADSPNFLSVWPDIEPLLSNYPIVCHNASFDYDVLEKTAGVGLVSPAITLELPHTAYWLISLTPCYRSLF